MKHLYYTFAAMACWGLWAFLPRLATTRLNVKHAMVWEFIGGFALALPIILSVGGRLQTGGYTFLYALATGLFGLAGALCYYQAMSLNQGQTASIITIASLYPIVSLLLAWFILCESPHPGQIVGMGLCLGGILLICYYTKA